jgi:hypothetical protein
VARSQLVPGHPLPWQLVPWIAALALAAGCIGVRGYADYDHEADFRRYQRFAFLPLRAPSPGSADTDPANSELVARRVRREIERVLVEKGYRKAPPEKADFLIGSQITTREKVDLYTYPSPYRWGPWYNAYDTVGTSYTEGTLVIDAVDARTEEVVWHGWASKAVGSDGGASQLASEAVDAILERFPAQGQNPG